MGPLKKMVKRHNAQKFSNSPAAKQPRGKKIKKKKKTERSAKGQKWRNNKKKKNQRKKIKRKADWGNKVESHGSNHIKATPFLSYPAV